MSKIYIAHCGGILTCSGYQLDKFNITQSVTWNNAIVESYNESSHTGILNTNSPCNFTDADAFVWEENDYGEKNLYIFKANSSPKMICTYKSNTGGTKIINDSTNIWAKEIETYDGSSGSITCNYDSFTSNTSYGIGSYETSAIYEDFVENVKTAKFSFRNVTRPTNNGDVSPDIPLSGNANMFSGCTDLVSCEIPCRMRIIGNRMFIGCTSLTSYTKNYDFIETIGISAFEGCTSLTELIIPPYTTLSENCFKGCSSATNIEFKLSKVSGDSYSCRQSLIPNGAFSGCTSLEKSNGFNQIQIPSGIKTIGENAFNFCTSMQELDTNSVSGIGQSAFANCTSLNKITMLYVRDIGYKAFSGCTSLTSITIPSDITNIGDYAFAGCNISSCTINAQTPPTVGANSFHGSYNIRVPNVADYQTQAAINKGWGAYTGRLI